MLNARLVRLQPPSLPVAAAIPMQLIDRNKIDRNKIDRNKKNTAEGGIGASAAARPANCSSTSISSCQLTETCLVMLKARLVCMQLPGLPVGRLRISRSNLRQTLLQHFQRSGQRISFGKVCIDAEVQADSNTEQKPVSLTFQVLPLGFAVWPWGFAIWPLGFASLFCCFLKWP